MSGTSADGIDAALVEIEGEGRGTRVKLVQFTCVPHDTVMREAILRLCSLEGNVPDLCALNFALGAKFAEAARAVTEGAGVSLSKVDAVASHGQTVWHQPEATDAGGVRARGTLQIGEPAVIAARTGCKVVSNFRAADMAMGGQGAPLVPYADWALLTSDEESRAVLNIGGIANVTHLPRSAKLDQVLAFDTGPGNMVIDALVRDFWHTENRMYDEGGALARRGKVNRRMVESLLEHPYFSQSPPKSTGREMFGWEFVRMVRDMKWGTEMRGVDMVATATAFTVESIAMAFQYELIPRGDVDTIIVGGGGSHNKTLMGMLAERLAPARLTTHDEFGIPSDAKEAMAFALLAYETLHGRPSNVPWATGASRQVVLGCITPP
jgi:anhydro-N-acetylmuramic acid kinase